MSYAIAVLDGSHDRSNFDCGISALNTYLQRQSRQDIRRKVAVCFVAIHGDSGQLAGYYTLSAASVALSDLPNDVAKKLPRYPSIPCARLGRLAVSVDHRGKGLGGALLFDALKRSIEADLAAFAMIVDAKDDAAAEFYRHHGFIEFAEKPKALFLPLATAEQIIKR